MLLETSTTKSKLLSLTFSQIIQISRYTGLDRPTKFSNKIKLIQLPKNIKEEMNRARDSRVSLESEITSKGFDKNCRELPFRYTVFFEITSKDIPFF